MKKLNINDFTKMIPKQTVGGSVAKAKLNSNASNVIENAPPTVTPSEAFNGQLKSGGAIPGPINPSNNINGATSGDPIKPKPKGIDPVVVVTLVVVAGLITWGALAIMQDREMYNCNNSQKK